MYVDAVDIYYKYVPTRICGIITLLCKKNNIQLNNIIKQLIKNDYILLSLSYKRACNYSLNKCPGFKIYFLHFFFLQKEDAPSLFL